MSKAKVIQEAKERLKILEKLYNTYKGYKWAKNVLGDYKKEIDELKEFLANSTSATDLVTGAVKEQALNKLDEFIEQYGNKEKTLIDVSTPSIPVASIGIITAKAKAGLTLDAKLASKREKNAVKSTGTIDGNGWVRLGIEVGFTAPVVGKIGMEGGIRGDVNLAGKSQLELTVAMPNLNVWMNPASLDLGLSAQLYLEMPDIWGMDDILEWITDGSSSMYSSGTTLYYKLGSINILVIKTPTYSITFDMSKGKFIKPKRSGSYSASLNKTVTNKINHVVSEVKYYASKLNPANWF